MTPPAGRRYRAAGCVAAASAARRPLTGARARMDGPVGEGSARPRSRRSRDVRPPGAGLRARFARGCGRRHAPGRRARVSSQAVTWSLTARVAARAREASAMSLLSTLRREAAAGAPMRVQRRERAGDANSTLPPAPESASGAMASPSEARRSLHVKAPVSFSRGGRAVVAARFRSDRRSGAVVVGPTGARGSSGPRERAGPCRTACRSRRASAARGSSVCGHEKTRGI
jgi:hypothetical protein